MKQVLLLLTLCLASICTQAQKIDTALFIGHWDLYSVGTSTTSTMYRDSIEQFIVATKKVDAASRKVRQTPQDSLAEVTDLRRSLADIFRSSFIFEKGGHFTRLIFSVDHPYEDKGGYQWVGENMFMVNRGKIDEAVFSIVSLTADRLVIKSEHKDKRKSAIMTFTRGK